MPKEHESDENNPEEDEDIPEKLSDFLERMKSSKYFQVEFSDEY